MSCMKKNSFSELIPVFECKYVSCHIVQMNLFQNVKYAESLLTIEILKFVESFKTDFFAEFAKSLPKKQVDFMKK